MITIELSEISTDNTPSERHGMNIASAEGERVTSFSSTIHPLARKLINRGHNPDAPVIVERDGKRIFDEQPLWRWAVLTTKENHGSLTLQHLSVDSLYSSQVNALIAKSRKDGPALLAAWHRDRGAELTHGVDDAEA